MRKIYFVSLFVAAGLMSISALVGCSSDLRPVSTSTTTKTADTPAAIKNNSNIPDAVKSQIPGH